MSYDEASGTVQTKLYVSLNGGRTYTTVSGTATGVASMFEDTSYLCFGKLSPGMADRGTDFRYKDLRVYNCALTLSELQGIVVEEYKEPASNKPQPNPDDSKNEDGNEDAVTTDTAEIGETTEPLSTEENGQSLFGCNASFAGAGAIGLTLAISLGLATLPKRRKE